MYQQKLFKRHCDPTFPDWLPLGPALPGQLPPRLPHQLLRREGRPDPAGERQDAEEAVQHHRLQRRRPRPHPPRPHQVRRRPGRRRPLHGHGLLGLQHPRMLCKKMTITIKQTIDTHKSLCCSLPSRTWRPTTPAHSWACSTPSPTPWASSPPSSARSSSMET